jgi:hypothetical protein
MFHVEQMRLRHKAYGLGLKIGCGRLILTFWAGIIMLQKIQFIYFNSVYSSQYFCSTWNKRVKQVLEMVVNS